MQITTSCRGNGYWTGNGIGFRDKGNETGRVSKLSWSLPVILGRISEGKRFQDGMVVMMWGFSDQRRGKLI